MKIIIEIPEQQESRFKEAFKIQFNYQERLVDMDELERMRLAGEFTAIPAPPTPMKDNPESLDDFIDRMITEWTLSHMQHFEFKEAQKTLEKQVFDKVADEVRLTVSRDVKK